MRYRVTSGAPDLFNTMFFVVKRVLVWLYELKHVNILDLGGGGVVTG